MKTKILLAFAVLIISSCVSTTTTTTAPDGTVTTTKVDGIDANTVTTVASAVTAVAKPRVTVDQSSK